MPITVYARVYNKGVSYLVKPEVKFPAEVVLLNDAESVVTPASCGGIWLISVTLITSLSGCSTHL